MMQLEQKFYKWYMLYSYLHEISQQNYTRRETVCKIYLQKQLKD